MFKIPVIGQSSTMIIIGMITFLLIILICSGGCFFSTGVRVQEPKTPTGTPQELTITDSSGANVTVRIPVHRVVSLNAATAELLVNIGATDQIVGVADFMIAENHPGMRARLSNATSVGALSTPDVETILKLRPDVLMAYTNKPQNYDQIVAANITLIQMSCYKPEDLAADARTLGALTGHETEAERYAVFTERYLALIRERTANISEHERPRGYMEYVNDYTAHGPGSGADRLLTFVHAINIGQNLPGQNVLVSKEWILEQDPDVIIKSVAPMKGNFSRVRNDIISRPGFSKLTAVQNGRVYIMTTGLVTTPRSVVGLLFVAKTLYPDRFSDINPEEVLEEYKREFGTGDDETDIFYPAGSNEPGIVMSGDQK